MIETGIGAAAAGAFIAAAFGLGTALVLTRTGKERRRDLKAEIEMQEKTLESLHRQANDLRRETAELTTMKAEADQIKIEYASLGERQAELRAWAREEVLELDKVEAKRRAAAGTEAELARLQEEWERRKIEKAKLDEEVEEARKRHGEAEAAASNAQEKKRELAEALAGQQEEIERKRGEAAELVGKRDELASQIGTAESRIEDLREEERNLKTRRDMLDEDLERLRGALGTNGEGPSDRGDRLGNLDEPPHLWFPDAANPTRRAGEKEEETLSKAIEAIKGQGLDFRDRVVHRFHTALKVSRISPLTVLAGISGTGKTQLPRAYARAMGIERLVVPVQPRWDGPRDLLGHFDFLHRRFQATELARLLYNYTHTERDGTGEYRLKEEGDDRMAIVLLDEMNLARTEYYFSEFLSRLELQGKEDEKLGAVIEKDRMVELDVPYLEEKDAVRVFPTQRILWVGTMNEDESTMTLSDKVIDRANILRFARPADMHRDRGQRPEPVTEGSPPTRHLSASEWNEWCATTSEDVGRTHDLIERINKDVMEPCGRSFGHRMSEAMVKYVEVYTGRSWEEGFADQVEMRLLPKLQGIDAQMDKAGDGIRQLAGMCDQELKDNHLADSIQRAQMEMQQTGTFNWKGRELQ